jgi:hypothetical protein
MVGVGRVCGWTPHCIPSEKLLQPGGTVEDEMDGGGGWHWEKP